DDQIETVLMHAARGAGLRGLCGMPMANGAVIRPMISVSREDILAYLKKNRLAYRQDSSNLDIRFARNRLRRQVIPQLKDKIAGFDGFMESKMAEAKKMLAALSKKAEKWTKKHMKNGRFSRREFGKLEKGLQAEIVIRLLGANDLYRKQIDNLILFFLHGQSGKMMTVKGHAFAIEYGNIALDVRPRVLPKIRLSEKGTAWGGWKIKVKSLTPLYVRPWRAGDRFRPAGMRGTKKLQDFFTDKKIPRGQRGAVPIIVDKRDRIVSVGNLRYDQNAKESVKSLKITPKR
ncbi:tRNA lysidine(34) synthetase TilS, partial [Candidatus Peregrinibacteria bacterium]|nr:tRNA lysidine(34) synthetase TilS [Candidatus Peregrinibacteria bacterium]